MENYKRFDPFTYDEDEIIWKNDWENEGENYELKTPRTLPPQPQTNIQNKIFVDIHVCSSLFYENKTSNIFIQMYKCLYNHS